MKLIYIICRDENEAQKIADALLKERLIACGNICAGIKSKYWWNGKLESATEALLLCKTADSRVAEAMKRAKELHSYDVPCILALGIERVNKEYENWLNNETMKQQKR